MARLDEVLAERFRCTKCDNSGAISNRFAATGTGISKIFDIQYQQFTTVSCKNCGYTEVYDPAILEKQSNLGTIMDILFGG